MPALRLVFAGLATLALVACATTPSKPDYNQMTDRQKELVSALASFTGAYDVSEAAMATAVLNERGKPIGLLAYNNPSAAVRAADTAAFIAAIKTRTVKDGEVAGFPALVLSIDQAADGRYQKAIDTLEPALSDDATSTMAGFLQAWFLAQNGEAEAAIEAHRTVTAHMPGLSGDLSLAALLDTLDRSEEALAVYSSITPGTIVAPEHDFDPQSLVFSHVQLVVARQALLLRRMGRVQDAQLQYQRLAAAEPEKSTRYDAAIEALATGRGLEDERLNVNAAFARALSDYSLSLAYQRLIRGALTGDRPRGYDETKGAFDLLALLIDPDNEDLRLAAFDDFYDEAMFDAAGHILSVAPEATTGLKMAEASVLIRQGDDRGAETAIARALELSDPDELLTTTTSAVGLYALMDKQDQAFKLAETLCDLAETEAEKATAHGISSAIYNQFAAHDLALEQAKAAVAIDNTHDRRMVLADRLAMAGQIEQGLTIMRDEALARPNDPYMLNALGYYLVIHTDRLDEAFRVLARAVNLAPNDPYISDSFGWVRFQLGDLDGAQFYIELSRKELAPNRHWEIEDHLGDIYWHQGKTDAAKEAWAFALNEFPPEEERLKIEDKLTNGLSEPAPIPQPLPDVSLSGDGEVERNDI